MTTAVSTVLNVRAATLSRDQILNAAAGCLRKYGYDATTIRRIAAELDCSVGSIYRYFRDKRQLMYTVSQQLLEPAALLAESRAPIELCEALYRRQVARSPQTYRLMFWLVSVADDVAATDEPAAPAAITDGRDTAAALLPDVITRMIHAWALSTGDIATARARWAELHGSVMLGEFEVAPTPAAAEPPHPQHHTLPPLPKPAQPDHFLKSPPTPHDEPVADAPIFDDEALQPADVAVEDDVCLL